MQHSDFDILYTSHTPFETFHWFAYMVVELHAHWNKHLLNVNFSYREHCWWLTSRTCVNTLINETNVKCEVTTLSIWDRSNGGTKEAQFPGRWVNMGRRKVLKMPQVLSSMRWICFRKRSGSNMRVQNLLLAPGAI